MGTSWTVVCPNSDKNFNDEYIVQSSISLSICITHRDVKKEMDENIKVDCNVKSILQLTMSWSYISHSKVEVYKEYQGMTWL